MVANITPLPPAPVRGSTEATFSAAANAFVAALPTLVTEINAAGDDIEQAVIDAEAAQTAAELAEVNAEAAESGAVSAANYKGAWSSLVGPLAIPATVSHNGVVWLLKANLADVTASEPTLVNADWIALTQPIETGSSALVSEFELEGDSAAVGDLVGLYSNGKIQVIKSHPGEQAFNSATSTFVNVIALSTTKGVGLYRDESDGNKIKLQLLNIAGRKVTLNGTPTVVANTSATYLHVDKIDGSNLIAVYQDTSDSSQGKVILINITGNTVTLGTAVPFNAAVTTYCKVAVLTTAKAVIAYRDEGNSNYGVCCTVAIAGLVATPSSEVNFKTAAVQHIDVCRLSDIAAVVSYMGTSSYPEAVVLDINPGIVVGTNFVIKSAATASTTISRLTDTTCVAAYESGSLLYARHLTRSAGVLNGGTELPIQANPSFLESCQLTSTRVLVSARNATVSNQGYYFIIDNTSGTTIAATASAAFNAGATSHTFLSMIRSDRILAGYQDNGNSNYGTAYVIDLNTATLKSVAGIVKEAGVEGNTLDVVTQGEVDFLSGLTPGSYYYSSATGALSATIGDYEVGVAKSATNLLLLERIQAMKQEWMRTIDVLFAAKRTPNMIEASEHDVWNTRDVKTTSGTFTVPANVYYLGIACCGKGGDSGSNGSRTSGGGGGGLALKVKKVRPGEQIMYTISNGTAMCDGMIANPGDNGRTDGSTSNGGTAYGGDYNYTGGSGGSYTYGGGGLGGGDGGAGTGSSSSGGGGGAGFKRLMWNENIGEARGGGYCNSTGGAYVAGAGGGAGGNGNPEGFSMGSSSGNSQNTGCGGGGLGVATPSIIPAECLCRGGSHLPYPKLMTMQMGFIVRSDFTGFDQGTIGYILQSSISQDQFMSQKDTSAAWGCGGVGAGFQWFSGSTFGPGSGGFGGGGGAPAQNGNQGAGSGGFGGGGAGASYSQTPYAGSGGFGAGGGSMYGGSGTGGSGGFGGGSGSGQQNRAGGLAVVVFIY